MNCIIYLPNHCRQIHLRADLQGLLLWVISAGNLLTMLLMVSVIKLPACSACGTTLVRSDLKR